MGAGLDPSQHGGGGQVPDGDYDIKDIRTGLFTYGGNVPEGVPAILVTYFDGGSEYEQPYKCGDNEHLVPNKDGSNFDHPSGGNPTILKGGAGSMFLASLAKAGYQFTSEDVRQLRGMRVSLESVPAPKGKSADNKDRVIPMVTKILAAPKGKAPAKAPAKTTTAGTNGTGDEAARAAVKGALAQVDGAVLEIGKLSQAVYVSAIKSKMPNAEAMNLKKLLTPMWLEANAEAGGWTVEGNTVIG